MLQYILLSSLVVSLISFVGLFLLSKRLKSHRFLFILVAFAAGAMLGNVFFHILPESLENLEPIKFSFIFLSGFIAFFIIEKLTHWRHCHDHDCSHKHDVKPLGFLNLIGDGVHNFLDGLLIAISYLVSFEIGIATTIAIIAHEIPQEIGDFSILLFSGFTKKKALFFNFISAILAVLGSLIGFFVLRSDSIIIYALPLVGGSLAYIATTDLIPELHKETRLRRSFVLLLSLIVGLLLLYALKVFL